VETSGCNSLLEGRMVSGQFLEGYGVLFHMKGISLVWVERPTHFHTCSVSN